MKTCMRLYRGEEDYWRIRGFLRDVFLANGRHELSWQVYRFDYWRWHGIENLGHGKLESDVFIWETLEGRMAAVLNREGPGRAFLQVHPGLRTVELEEEMIAVAEEHLAAPGPNGVLRLRVACPERDELRRDILTRRGYIKQEFLERHHRRPLARPIPEVPVPAGYTVRSVGDGEELPARSFVSWKAFHPGEPDDRYQGWEWYRNIQRAPLYRRDLDIVVTAPDDTFASFCTIWFDDVTRTGAFEPVGTAPEHQRRGLGRAAMFEGLRRLGRMGALLACVGSESPDAYAFYTSNGFAASEETGLWAKEL